MRARIAVCMFALALELAVAASAGQVGDAAPPLAIKEWIKGGPVDLAAGKGKQVYVIEFWATWCGPCRLSAPHLTKLQKQYRDQVTIIGVTSEDPAIVKRYLEAQGEKIGYTIAVDNQRDTFGKYMQAFGRGGIPHAFVIDKRGNIVWEGHPMSTLDEAISKTLAGELGGGPDFVELRKQYFAKSADATPEDLRHEGQAYIEAASGDVEVLIALGNEILAQPEPRDRHLASLYALAQAAVKASKGKDPAAHEMLAEVYFMNGQLERAERYAKLALRPPQPDGDRERRTAALKKYSAALTSGAPASAPAASK